jgi:hypothetical protein
VLNSEGGASAERRERVGQLVERHGAFLSQAGRVEYLVQQNTNTLDFNTATKLKIGFKNPRKNLKIKGL